MSDQGHAEMAALVLEQAWQQRLFAPIRQPKRGTVLSHVQPHACWLSPVVAPADRETCSAPTRVECERYLSPHRPAIIFKQAQDVGIPMPTPELPGPLFRACAGKPL